MHIGDDVESASFLLRKAQHQRAFQAVFSLKAATVLVFAASKSQTYSASVTEKQNIFLKDSNSISKIVTPIIANVRSIYGKNATETENIMNLVTKIRGIKVARSSSTENTDTVSQSERSYGTILQTFSDIITTLTIFGTNYSPTNAECSVTKRRREW